MELTLFVILGILAVAVVQAVERRWKNAVIAFLVATNVLTISGLVHSNSMFRARMTGMEKVNEALKKTISEFQQTGSNNADAPNRSPAAGSR